jgi:phosphoserine phosphatase
MLDELGRLRDGGCSTVLLTATLECLAVPLAGEAGIDTVLASRPESRDGRLTGRVPLRPWGRDKLSALEGAGIDPGWCTAYGDSWSDRHLMEACAGAVAVSPGRRLRRLAGMRGWRVLEGG